MNRVAFAVQMALRPIAAVSTVALLVLACAPRESPPEAERTWVGTITTEGNVTTVAAESGSVWGETATLVEQASIGVEAGALVLVQGHVPAAAPQAPELLAEAIRDVYSDATEWTVREAEFYLGGVDKAVIVTLAPHERSPRITKYRTVLCEYVAEPESWDCTRGLAQTRMEIQPLPNATSCAVPVRDVLNLAGLSDDLLLQVVDAVRHSAEFGPELAAACGTSWRPPDVPFESWRCGLSVVAERDEGTLGVLLGAGPGCSQTLTLDAVCSEGGQCRFTPLKCGWVCA